MAGQPALSPAHRLPKLVHWSAALRVLTLLTLILASGSVCAEDRAGRRGSRHLLEAQPPQPSTPFYSQGQYVLPNATAGAAGAGTLLFPGLAPLPVTELAAAADNLLPSPQACSDACRQLARCNVFAYCSKQGGCRSREHNLSSPLGGCQLSIQEASAPGTARPAVMVPAPGFTGGAPLRFTAPEIQGYDMWPGLGYWYRFDFTCQGSESQPGSCGFKSEPESIPKQRCDADPECRAMVYFPQGRDYWQDMPVTLLKGQAGQEAMNLATANYNQNSVLYLKREVANATAVADEEGGGGLAGGTIAGIVVGACCGLALLVATGVLIVQRRRRWDSTGLMVKLQASSSGGSREVVAAASAPAAAKGAPPPARAAKGAPLAPPFLQGAPAGMQQGAANAGAFPAAFPGAYPGAFPGGQACPGGRHPGSANPSAPHSQHPTPPASGPLSSLGATQSSCSSPAPSLVPPLARPAGSMPFPPAPPPTEASAASGAFSTRPPSLAGHAEAGAGAGGISWRDALQELGLGWGAPSGAAGSGGEGAEGGAGQGAAAAVANPLLARLPDDSWQRSVVDYQSIEFCRTPEGGYEELGFGAFSTVYRVLLDGVQPHAAKVLWLGGDPKAQLYFLREAGLLRQLRHRNIVNFAGVSVAGSNGIILMELMDGGDLRSRITEVDASGERVFAFKNRGGAVALDVACALHYLHSRNLTHFDVKARNVLLSRGGEAKLADVGFARAMRTTHHSIEGPAGTFDYMAPELLMGRQCTASVDCFSFGVLLWELCTGKSPIRGAMPPPKPQECPPDVAELLRACLSEDPAMRPSARTLVERLTEILQQQGQQQGQQQLERRRSKEQQRVI